MFAAGFSDRDSDAASGVFGVDKQLCECGNLFAVATAKYLSHIKSKHRSKTVGKGLDGTHGDY
jgi:hypothetical protein